MIRCDSNNNNNNNNSMVLMTHVYPMILFSASVSNIDDTDDAFSHDDADTGTGTVIDTETATCSQVFNHCVVTHTL